MQVNVFFGQILAAMWALPESNGDPSNVIAHPGSISLGPDPV